MNIILRHKGFGYISCATIVCEMENRLKIYRDDREFPVADHMFRWGCTTRAEARMTINEAGAISTVSDKLNFRRKMNPQQLCPFTWFSPVAVRDGWNFDDGSLVIRPRSHTQGQELHVVNDYDELEVVWARLGEAYASKLIAKVAEYRVFIVQGRVVNVANKVPEDRNVVAWNNSVFGAMFENLTFGDWPLRAVKRSVDAFKLSGLDFGAVDVMEDADGEAFVLEINTAPAIESEYRSSCIARAFDYIIANGKAPIPTIKAKGNWKKFVHPAVSDKAIV